MKKVIYDEVIDINNIKDMYCLIKSKTKHKKKLIIFNLFYNSNIFDIYNTLLLKKYNHGKYNIFIIKYPKQRVILSESLNDKIVNHLISKYILEPCILKRLIDGNIATRKNMGTSYGIKLLKQYINKLKVNNRIYVLKMDIKKYFFNIDHEILITKLSNIINDKSCLNIIINIINSTNKPYINKNISSISEDLPQYKYNKGLPIGNMSSQILAIYYLNDLDHYIKEVLKAKYYIRYMDDFIILSNDKDYLKKCLYLISIQLINLKLELNNKTNISELRYGFNFLGYHFKTDNNKLCMRVTSKNKYRIRRKLKHLKKYHYDKYLLSKISYKGYFNKY